MKSQVGLKDHKDVTILQICLMNEMREEYPTNTSRLGIENNFFNGYKAEIET